MVLPVKKQSKIILAVLGILLLTLAVLTILHLHTREQVPENALAIHVGDQVRYLEQDKLPLGPVQGTVINGKGEEKPVDAEGIALADVLREAGLDPEPVKAVTVRASDEFSAEIAGDELNEPGKVFLYRSKDGSFTLVVFGDANAKRHVKNVEAIDVFA